MSGKKTYCHMQGSLFGHATRGVMASELVGVKGERLRPHSHDSPQATVHETVPASHVAAHPSAVWAPSLKLSDQDRNRDQIGAPERSTIGSGSRSAIERLIEIHPPDERPAIGGPGTGVEIGWTRPKDR
eukprot:11402555-Alexandrium_andersonii.AAC.1